MSQNIGPVSMTPGSQKVINLPNPSAIQTIKVTNGTPFDITYSGFGVQGSSVIPAGTEYMLHAEILNTGQLTLLPVNNVGVAGTGNVNVVVFYQDEPVPPGTWPIAVPAQIVSAKVSTITVLVNDGSAPATQIIESTPSDAGSSTISVLNDGTVTIKGDVAGALTTLLQLIPNAGGGASNVKLSASGNTTEVLGKLLVDNQIQINGSVGNITSDAAGALSVPWRIIANLIDTVTGNDFTISCETGHKIALQVNNTDVARINNLGLVLVSGGVNFTTGSLSQISSFSSTGTGATQTLNHGLSVTPDFFIFQYAGNFGTPPTHPIFWFNATATQVSVHADSGYFYTALAIKF